MVVAGAVAGERFTIDIKLTIEELHGIDSQLR